MLVMELHVKTRKDLRPDPELDPIKALFYTVTFDSPQKNQETGAIIVNDMNLSNFGVSIPLVHRVSKEEDLILKLIQLMKTWDPDILAGYEIEMNSWGYLVQRGFVLELNLLSLLGRVRSENSLIGEKKSAPSNETDEFVDVPRSIKNMKISGRIVLDIWRVLRHEVKKINFMPLGIFKLNLDVLFLLPSR